MRLVYTIERDGVISLDLQSEVDPTHTVSDLCRALSEYEPLGSPVHGLELEGQQLKPDELISESSLVNGVRLTVSSTASPEGDQTIARITDTRTNTAHRLEKEAVVIGSDYEADIRIDLTAKNHARVWRTTEGYAISAVGESRLPLSAVTDVAVNGSPVAKRGTALNDGDVVALGDVVLRFSLKDIGEAPKVRDQVGLIPFHRTPHYRDKSDGILFEAIGDVPQRAKAARFRVLASVTPAIGGVAMALMFGRMAFLWFALLAPVTAVASGFDQRWADRKDFKAQQESFDRRLLGRAIEVERAVARERVRHERRFPLTSELTARAENLSHLLWNRPRSAEDYLVLRVGTADLPPTVAREPEKGGDEEYRAKAAQRLDELLAPNPAPLELDLRVAGTTAIFGDEGLSAAMAASLVTQATTLHSPEDLVVLAAVAAKTGLDFAKWLPHTRSSQSPLDGPHFAADSASANGVLRSLVDVVEMRSRDAQVDLRWPWILLVLDSSLELDPALVAKVLDAGTEVGISAIWLCEDIATTVRQAGAVLDLRILPDQSMISFPPDGSDSATAFQHEVDVSGASQSSRALAPLRDASAATLTSAIPRNVDLVDALGLETIDGLDVDGLWATNNLKYSLAAPIGVDATGPISIDLIAEGPHALIGGTSGAGKSELLQTIVASMAAHHGPDRLNFLFIDYKGGASSKQFEHLPHQVGYVTNLNPALARRALTSLRAELNNRMATLSEHSAKDLETMLRERPEACPPSLVIVVDEFATLIREIPEFVAGIVDIAQRGRSLGIHLILATQRPSGSVDENILANTNLRISLRMLDAAESKAVIDTADAALIPAPLKGRALKRTGAGQIVQFQSGYASAPSRQKTTVAALRVMPFPESSPARSQGSEVAQDEEAGRTQLADLVTRLASMTFRPPQAPWRPELGVSIEIKDLRLELAERELATPGFASGRFAVLGRADRPQDQSQPPSIVDLEQGGGLVIYGAGGAGKTTALRTVLTGLELGEAGPSPETEFVCLDFGNGSVSDVASSPRCRGLASGEDLEMVTFLLESTYSELLRRKSEGWNGKPRIVFAIDGLDGFTQTFTGGSHGEGLHTWPDRLDQIVQAGRQVGIHAVLTVERPAVLTAILRATISNRLVLRQVGPAAFLDLGVPAHLFENADFPAGRGIVNESELVQVAVSPKGNARTDREGSPPARPLSISHGSINAVRIGIEDISLDEVSVDLARASLFVVGPPNSGRTSALELVARQLIRLELPLWVLGPGDSSLADLNCPNSAFGPDARTLLGELDAMTQIDPGQTRFVVIDDFHRVADPSDYSAFRGLVDGMADRSVRVVASTTTSREHRSDAMTTRMKEEQEHLLYLSPDSAVAVNGFREHLRNAHGDRFYLRPGLRMATGRGVLVSNRVTRLVHMADSVQSDDQHE